jgi:hypothetical protein
MKPYQISKVKNSLVQSVYYAFAYTTCSVRVCCTHWPWVVHPILAICFATQAHKVAEIILRPTRRLRRTQMLLFWSPMHVVPNSVIPRSILLPCYLLFLAPVVITAITSTDLVGQMCANCKWVWVEQGTMSASTFLGHGATTCCNRRAHVVCCHRWGISQQYFGLCQCVSDAVRTPESARCGLTVLRISSKLLQLWTNCFPPSVSGVLSRSPLQMSDFPVGETTAV